MNLGSGLQIALSVLTLLGVGICIGMVRMSYVTHKQLNEHEEKCWKNIDRQYLEMAENRKSVWHKIDMIYEHLLREKTE
jgi:hypothetical protein